MSTRMHINLKGRLTLKMHHYYNVIRGIPLVLFALAVVGLVTLGNSLNSGHSLTPALVQSCSILGIAVFILATGALSSSARTSQGLHRFVRWVTAIAAVAFVVQQAKTIMHTIKRYAVRATNSSTYQQTLLTRRMITHRLSTFLST